MMKANVNVVCIDVYTTKSWSLENVVLNLLKSIKKMKINKLTFKGIKNVLSKDEMKNITAGSGNCLGARQACNDDVQCCSNDCVNDSKSGATGKSCNGDHYWD